MYNTSLRPGHVRAASMKARSLALLSPLHLLHHTDLNLFLSLRFSLLSLFLLRSPILGAEREGRTIFCRCRRGILWEAGREMASSRRITLRSSDGESFEVEQSIAEDSPVLKNVIEDCENDIVIPLPNVNSKILAKMIEYWKKHEELKAYDVDFVKVDQATLFDLILAANYLNIKSLLDLTCQRKAEMIKFKTPEEIRKTFRIRNDLTPEEEQERRRENQWAFE